MNIRVLQIIVALLIVLLLLSNSETISRLISGPQTRAVYTTQSGPEWAKPEPELETEQTSQEILFGEKTPDDGLYFQSQSTNPEQPLWALLGEKKYAQIHAQLTRTQLIDPGFVPSQNFTDELARAERAEKINNAIGVEQFNTVIELAQQSPKLNGCARPYTSWNITSALAATGRYSQAENMITTMLSECELTNTEIRDGFAIYASQVEPQTMTTLLSKVPNTLFSIYEREHILLQSHRNVVQDWIEAQSDKRRQNELSYETRTDALYVYPESYPDAQVKNSAQAFDMAETTLEPGDRLLMGWYNYNLGQVKTALDWFRSYGSLVNENERLNFAIGEALTLVLAQQYPEAETILPTQIEKEQLFENTSYRAVADEYLAHADRDYRDPLWIESYSIPQNIMTRLEEMTNHLQDASLSQQIAWHALRLDNCTRAIEWFKQSITWDDEQTEAIWGLALCYRKTEQFDAFNSLRMENAPEDPRWLSIWVKNTPLIEGPKLKTNMLSEFEYIEPQTLQATATPSRVKTPARTTQRASTPPARTGTSAGQCRAGADPTRMSASSSLAHGWCMMELNRPFDAIEAFDVALSKGNTAQKKDATYGKSLALMRKGLARQATQTARGADLSAERKQELNTSILSQNALTSFRQGNYRAALQNIELRSRVAPITPDLLTLKGWSHWKLNQRSAARAAWKAAANAGSADAQKALRDTQ